ncbi:hypothetical protein ACFFNY_25045 [Paenibacillus hodogayensis]|uniref:PhiEco32-like amidoligase-type 2 protein n=1 Tax=Paenibacillus hodogayensis TaxID=279208 RepID=A0ABV5W3F7_9BACL
MDGLYAEAERLGLNAAAGSAQAAQRGRAVARMLGYGAGEDGKERDMTHRYRFYVFRLEIMAEYSFAANAVYAANGARVGLLYGPGGSTGDGKPDGVWRRVEPDDVPERKRRQTGRAAVRLLYLCGLDFGMIDMGMSADGPPTLLRLEPFPKLDARLTATFAESLKLFRDGEHAAETDPLTAPVALLGADPEFLLMNADGQVMPASAFLPREGQAGCDRVRIGGRVLYPLAELRPQPSADPRRLVSNVRRTLLTAAELIPDTPGARWLAGGMPAKGFALGGHIHISRTALNVPLLKALDNYLALPLLLIEDERSKARRPRYGMPGDFRRQPHGGFEYRTLPSWLVSPRVAKGVLALTALIARHYRELGDKPLDRPDVLRHYLAGDKKELRPVALALLGQIRELPDYAEFAGMTEPLLTMIEKGECWDEGKDFRRAWQIGTPAGAAR